MLKKGKKLNIRFEAILSALSKTAQRIEQNQLTAPEQSGRCRMQHL
jgi:hypothetical protein